MDRKESLLGIDFELVADLTQNPAETYYSREYRRGIRNHMHRNQPLLEKLLESQPIFSPVRHRHFQAGAYGTYDLIVSADNEHWTKKQLSSDIIASTKRNFHDAYIPDKDTGIKVKDNRLVVDVLPFYEQVTQDSPTYADWLQMRVDDVRDKGSAYDFIYGSLLTAMPFYYSRQGEILAKLFDF